MPWPTQQDRLADLVATERLAQQEGPGSALASGVLDRAGSTTHGLPVVRTRQDCPAGSGLQAVPATALECRDRRGKNILSSERIRFVNLISPQIASYCVRVMTCSAWTATLPAGNSRCADCLVRTMGIEGIRLPL